MRVGQRRLRSGRGAAFLEFALLAPFLLMICSLMIETAVFWDASVMANHTAWTVGRMMKVKTSSDTRYFKIGEIGKKDDSDFMKALYGGMNKVIGGVNLLADQRNLTTILLMSSCSMGYVGKPGDEFADLFKAVISEPTFEMAQMALSLAGLMFMDGDALPEDDEKGGGNFVDKIRKSITDWAIKKVVKPLYKVVMEEIIEKGFGGIEKKLQGVGQKVNALFDQKGEFSPMKHYARNFQKAVHRVASLSDGKKGALVLTQTANTGDIGTVNFLEPTGTQTYPQANVGSPGYKDQLVLVRVQWPMESDWLFPLFWGGVREDKGVWASGHSLVLRETTLKNTDLASDGKSSYTPPEANKPPFGNVGDEIRKDSRIELFLMRYRNARETLHVKGGTAKTKYVQPWREIAYSDGVTTAYKKSWEKCLRHDWWERFHLEDIVKGWLPGYLTREWLWYESIEESSQRFRYTGTDGPSPTTEIKEIGFDQKYVSRGILSRKKNVYSPTKMLETLQALGYGLTLPKDPGAAVLNAHKRATDAVSHYQQLRKLVDANIAELTKRVEGNGASDMELDLDTLNSITGEELTEGDNDLSEKRIREKWAQTLKELKACRDRLNPIVKRIAEARAEIQTVNDNFRDTLFKHYKNRVDDFFELETASDKSLFGWSHSKMSEEEKATKRAEKRARIAESLVAIYENKLLPRTQELAEVATKLDTDLAAAMAEEIRIGQLFGLNATSKLNPDNIHWDSIAAGTAEDDGVKPTEDPTEDGRSYGDKDGRGEGPWTR